MDTATRTKVAMVMIARKIMVKAHMVGMDTAIRTVAAMEAHMVMLTKVAMVMIARKIMVKAHMAGMDTAMRTIVATEVLIVSMHTATRTALDMVRIVQALTMAHKSRHDALCHDQEASRCCANLVENMSE